MINMPARNPNPSATTLFSSLKQSEVYRNSVHLTPISVSYINRQLSKNPTQTIIIDANQFEKQKQILQWRQNTDFPIVKIKSYKLLQEKHTLGKNFLQILVQLQSQMKIFDNITKIPFFQAIYILKESMIGFQRLCHRFGFFNVSSKMIMFNETQNCKVWMNQNWYSNSIEYSDIKSQKHFILQICNIIEQKAVKSKMCNQFFDKMKNCKYFFQGICAIDTYAKTNKIKIPNKFQNLDQIKSPMLKTSMTLDFNLNSEKQKNLVTSSKIPRFIKKNQVKKQISHEVHEVYTPLPRKMTMATQACIHDQSLTNISRNHSSNSFLKNDFQDDKMAQHDDQRIDEDNFLKDLNIRLIEPNNDESRKTIPSSPNFPSQYLNSVESPFSPFGMVSQIDSNQDKKSGYSFNKCASRQQLSPFETAQRMFLTVFKSNGNDNFNTPQKFKPQYSPRCIRTLQYLEADVQSLEDYEHYQSKQNKFMPLSINQIRDKRKLSGDYGNSSGRNQTQQKINGNHEIFTPQYKTQNLLNVPNKSQNKIRLTKTPSHQVIRQFRYGQNDQQAQEKEIDERQFLRETIMNKNGWEGLSILKDRKPIQQSFVDDTIQTPVGQQSKTSELPKLGIMGRDVKTSMISNFEFDLEYGDKIQKQKSIRDEVSGLLD